MPHTEYGYRTQAQKKRLLRTVQDVWGEDTVDLVLQMTGNAIRMQQDLDKMYESAQEFLIEAPDTDEDGKTLGPPKIVSRTEFAVVVNNEWNRLAQFVVPKPKPVDVNPFEGDPDTLLPEEQETRARLLGILQRGIDRKKSDEKVLTSPE